MILFNSWITWLKKKVNLSTQFYMKSCNFTHWSKLMLNVGILDSVLKWFKDSGEIAIKNMVPTVLQNPLTRTSDEWLREICQT